YGGAALGAIMAVTQFKAGNTDLVGTLFIIVLAADFFIPMRQLGSYFHVAMNGMAAGDKIFRLLDLPEESQENKKQMTGEGDIVCKSLCFSYTKEREILHGLDLSIKKGSFCAIVGESGCGKSTVAAILMGRKKDYQGSVRIDGMEAPPHCVSAAGRAGQDKNAARWSGSIELRDISEESLLQNMAYVSHQSYLFRGTVRDNLLMGKPEASEEELWQVLEQVKLADFLRAEDGLDTKLLEQGSNLSGGQRQRLALARALLFDAKVYIFDEATSNIDVESENDIMENICALAGQKTVILISHRLANVVSADQIYVLEDGSLAESGTHKELLKKQGAYAKLWNTQMELENFGNIRMSSVNSDGSGYPEAERMGKKRGEQI
ncbi:MAG: ATP-binding cassette domain-containing protein, partial [Lachnospiraceae bacterium]|nr:ATP-binding cassette domain-containing protein [Lachnospiraceae bacterium]